MHPIFILALVAGGIAYMSYRNKRRLGLAPSGPLALPPGPEAGPGPVPTGPMAPWQVDPGMPPQYAHAVWTALAYEREPHRLRAFGERMREMRMHRAASALHGRAAALEQWHGGGRGGHGYGGHGYGGHGYGGTRASDTRRDSGRRPRRTARTPSPTWRCALRSRRRWRPRATSWRSGPWPAA